MGEETGATVHLDRVPLKYAGLRYDEIWISEAQERMVLAVPPGNVEALLKLARDENVEATVIGTFGTDNQELVLYYTGQLVGRLSMDFLHHGLPSATRRAVVIRDSHEKTLAAVRPGSPEPEAARPQGIRDQLLQKLAHPTIASKHWLIRQYDHEVQGGSVIKPLVGPLQIGPSDAAVIRPKLSSQSGIAIACGLAPGIKDPYDMAIAAIDEAIRNAICVGADFDRIAILDNFCWPSVDDEITMGTLVRACEACRDAALAFGIPFISGKDSLHNQFTDKETGKVIRIPNTLLISAIGIIPDVRQCVTMDFKPPACPVYLISAANPADLKSLAGTHHAMCRLIAAGHAAAVHDVSDGGWLVAAAEMCIASARGLNVHPDQLAADDPFAECPGRYIVELTANAVEANIQIEKLFSPFGRIVHLGFVQHRPSLLVMTKEKIYEDIPITELTAAWRGTLDW
jgi:phosphoribosylformylglycinamidine synthase